MEQIDNDIDVQMSALARTLLILNNYDWLCRQAQAAGVRIVPIKGMDLLQTVYKEKLDRDVKDIDILCFCDEDCRRLVNQLCQEDYRLEFPFSMNKEVLAAKKKVSLLSCSTSKVNVDVHISLVTKRFFSLSIGSFNQDAMARCGDSGMQIHDKWLFLAQHAAFHLYCDKKWERDLQVLLPLCGETRELASYAEKYGFRRVLLASLYHMHKDDEQLCRTTLENLALTGSDKRFLKFVSNYDRVFTRKAMDRLIAAFWEFVFIQDRGQRFKSWMQLLFPSKGNLRNIYRVKSTWAVAPFYVVNIVVVMITSLIFMQHYIYSIFIRR